MRFEAIDHIGYAVSSLDRSIRFYTLLLGDGPFLRKTWEQEYLGQVVGYPGAKLDCAMFKLPNGAVLELLEYLQPEASRVDMESYNAGNAHLCLVTGDISEDYERLRPHGVQFRSPFPVEIPWGPYRGGKVCYMRDPDGISIELIQLPPGGPDFAR